MVKRELVVAGRHERADGAPVSVLGAEHVAPSVTDRLHRERSLPAGYQFGEAGKHVGLSLRFIRQYDTAADRDLNACHDFVSRTLRAAFLRGAPDYDAAIHGEMVIDAAWRAPHLNAAERLANAAQRVAATSTETEPRLFLSTIHDPDRWNVIEGEDH